MTQIAFVKTDGAWTFLDEKLEAVLWRFSSNGADVASFVRTLGVLEDEGLKMAAVTRIARTKPVPPPVGPDMSADKIKADAAKHAEAMAAWEKDQIRLDKEDDKAQAKADKAQAKKDEEEEDKKKKHSHFGRSK